MAAVVAVPRFLQHQMRQGYDLGHEAHEAHEARKANKAHLGVTLIQRQSRPSYGS